jgi:hypothetical protein
MYTKEEIEKVSEGMEKRKYFLGTLPIIPILYSNTKNIASLLFRSKGVSCSLRKFPVRE